MMLFFSVKSCFFSRSVEFSRDTEINYCLQLFTGQQMWKYEKKHKDRSNKKKTPWQKTLKKITMFYNKL